MKLKATAGEARWILREKAWDIEDVLADRATDLEERVLWRGEQAARRAVTPLQRLIQTRLAWPLADAMRDRSGAAQTAVATTAVVAALAAGGAGAMVASGGPGQASSDPGLTASAPAPLVSGPATETLDGVAPDFTAGTSPAKPAAGAAVDPAAPAGKVQPGAPPAQVAMKFAEAFVRYEVGEVTEQTTRTFSTVAEKPLAQSLSADPPRLPDGAEVPQARVINVVLGEQKGEELQVSVALARLQAASELRLTLRQDPKAGWRVVEVLG